MDVNTDGQGKLHKCCYATGGWLYQAADSLVPEGITFTVVSEAQPTDQQLQDLKFAWRSVKHVKSNAITVAKDGRLLGMGSGQPNRVKSVEIALEKAGNDVEVGSLTRKPYLDECQPKRMLLQGSIMSPELS